MVGVVMTVPLCVQDHARFRGEVWGRGYTTLSSVCESTIAMKGLSCTQLILQQLFSYCNTLLGTLDRLQELGCGLVICDGDPACYTRLCQTTIIGSNRSDIFLGPASSSTVFNPGRKMALSDIVTWVVSTSSKQSSVFGLGYSKGAGNHMNTMLNYLDREEFHILHGRVGDDIIRFLLLHCSLFVELSSQNYMQISGPPLYNLIPSSCIPINKTKLKVTAEKSTSSRKRKRISTAAQEPQHTTQFQHAASSIEGEFVDSVYAAPETKRLKSNAYAAERRDERSSGHQNTHSSEPCHIQHENRQHIGDMSEMGIPCNPTDYTCLQARRNCNKMRLRRPTTSRHPTCPPSNLRRQEKLSKWLLSLSLVRRKKVCQWLARRGVGKGTKRRVLQRVCPKKKHPHPRRKRGKTGGKGALATVNRALTGTCFTKTAMFYSPSLREGFPDHFVLNRLENSKNATRKLVASIFQGKPITATHHIKPTDAADRTTDPMTLPQGKPVIPVQHVLLADAGPRTRSQKKAAKGRGRRTERLPPRLQRAVPLLQKVITNHRRCRYRFLLKHHCSTPKLPSAKDESIPPKAYYSQLVTAYSSHDQILRFLQSVVNNVIPDEMWGSTENKLTFFRHLREFVSLRRWELMSVKQLLVGIKLSHCSWLRVTTTKGDPIRARNDPPQRSPSDSLKETELFSKWLLWLMNDLIIPTIKTFFYVTEHSDYRNHVFYYRKAVWSRVVNRALKDRSGVMLSPVTKEEVGLMLLHRKTLGVSKLRLLPKSNGVRPIMKLGSKVKLPVSLPGRQVQVSVNYQLQNALHILRYEKDKRPEIVGSTCTGYEDIHHRLRMFKHRQTEVSSGESRPLLFVRVDIANCYDSILPEKLFDILQHKVLTKPTYLLRRYTTAMVSKGKIRRCFKKAATTRAECEPFFQFASNLSKNTSLRNAILTDMVLYPVESRMKILEQLRNHLFGNVIQVKGEYYRQVQGIPQGSTLSSLLCSFYYSELEKECLPKMDPENELLMRYIDDFLLITRDPRTAGEFLSTMTRGIPEYNCYINPAKTVTNVAVQEDGSVKVLEEVQWVQWCGLLVNTQTLDVQYDYARYTKKSIRDNITFARHSNPFHNLSRLTSQAVQLRCDAIFLDCEMLSEKTVMTNIYQGFLLAATKFKASVRALSLGKSYKKYTRFFLSIILQSIRHFHSLAKSKCSAGDSKDTTFTIAEPLCSWGFSVTAYLARLGCHAFATILKRRNRTAASRQVQGLAKHLMSRVASITNKVGLRQVKLCCLRATKSSNSRPLFTIKC